MALVYLSARKDPVEVKNDKAVAIKKRWIGDGVTKAPLEDIVDLGWVTFSYGQIRQIEIQAERTVDDEDYNRQLTPSEKERRRKIIARIRNELVERGVLDAPKQTERGLNTVSDLLK